MTETFGLEVRLNFECSVNLNCQMYVDTVDQSMLLLTQTVTASERGH